jgi:3-oxoacyl-[acyl-carrier-protein] synthase-3
MPFNLSPAYRATAGHTGSVALPTAMAIGFERGHANPGDNIALLGIGSGINCVMLAVQWQKTLA